MDTDNRVMLYRCRRLALAAAAAVAERAQLADDVLDPLRPDELLLLAGRSHGFLVALARAIRAMEREPSPVSAPAAGVPAGRPRRAVSGRIDSAAGARGYPAPRAMVLVGPGSRRRL